MPWTNLPWLATLPTFSAWLAVLNWRRLRDSAGFGQRPHPAARHPMGGVLFGGGFVLLLGPSCCAASTRDRCCGTSEEITGPPCWGARTAKSM